MSIHAALTWFLVLHVLLASASIITSRDNDVTQNDISPWVIKGIVVALVLAVAAFVGFYLYRKVHPVARHPGPSYRITTTPNWSPVMGRRPRSTPVARALLSSSPTSQPSAVRQQSFSGQNTALNTVLAPPKAHIESH